MKEIVSETDNFLSFRSIYHMQYLCLHPEMNLLKSIKSMKHVNSTTETDHHRTQYTIGNL